MTHPFAHGQRSLFAGLAAALAVLILGPAGVSAHADLVTSDPANGSTLTTSPTTITATFAEEFDTTRSSMQLLRPDGATLAANAAATSATAESMTISGFGSLAGGTYSVRWTTITPNDNGIERGTFTFTIATATGAPPADAGGSAGSGGSADVVLPLAAVAALVLVGLAWLVRRSR